VIGDARVGNNCLVGAGCSIMGGSVPDNHIAFGQRPMGGIRPTQRNVIRDIFKDG